MIKKLSEKIIRLNEKDLSHVTICIFVFIFLIFCSGLLFGNIVGRYEEQSIITKKLITLSEKENNSFPDNNFFKINNQIYAVSKVNISWTIINSIKTMK